MLNCADRLCPTHLDNLRVESGLSDETILRSGAFSVSPREINKILGPHFPHPERVNSLLCLPYPDGGARYRLFPPTGTRKYHQQAGTQNRLYIPPGVEKALSDPSIPLYIAEGEKKSLKSTQEGLACVALGGLWSWCDGTEAKNLIPDFDKINLNGRTVYLIPDNDWLNPDRHGERRNLRQAVYELGYRLIDRDAAVYIIELPQGPAKGVDDYLCHHTVEEFHELPKHPVRKQTIDEMINEVSLDTLPGILKRLAGLPETERAVHINELSKKLDIPKRSIQKDLQNLSYKKEDHPDIERLLNNGANPESHYSGQNFIDGILSFGAILGKEKIIVQSDGQITLADGSGGDSFRFKRTALTVETIKRFRAGEDVDGRELLNRIQTLFSDHVILGDDRIPTLLGVWIVGTYLFKAFRFYGYLWINSPVKRCAKSLVLDILSLVCFNATGRLVDPSPSFLFREVDCNDRTLIVDETESLGGSDKEAKSELISLLNAGFQRGAEVPRMEKKNNEFVSVSFNAYCPKALAGIKSIVDTVEDRAFKIPMFRKKKSETVKRFNLRVLDSHISKIREDCFIWALQHASDVCDLYNNSDTKFSGIESFDDRLKDIIEPLLSIASVIDMQIGEITLPTVQALINLSKDLGKGREAAEDLNSAIPVAVSTMKALLNGEEEKFAGAEEIFEKFGSEDDLGFIHSKRGMAFFLSKLGINRTSERRGDKIIRGYILFRKHLDDLGARYA